MRIGRSPCYVRFRRSGPVYPAFVSASVRQAGSCCGCLFPLPTTAAYAYAYKLVH